MELMKQDRPAELVREEVSPMSILQVAMSQDNFDVDKMTKLLELQERWDANQAKKAFNAAMAQFKENPPKISKNKHVKFKTEKGFTEYDHATLGHVVDQITAALSAVGISHKWKPKQEGPSITVTCILTHSMGHSEETPLTATADTSGGKNSIQAIGSTVTYLERYTLLAAVGMAAELDTDGVPPGTDDAGMEQGEFERLCGLIENAGSIPALETTYLAACKDARDLGDEPAIRKFAELKNKRYRELAPPVKAGAR